MRLLIINNQSSIINRKCTVPILTDGLRRLSVFLPTGTLKLLKREVDELYSHFFQENYMKYFVAIVGGLIIFIGAWLISGILLAMILPVSWSQTWINLGLLSTNIPSLIAFVIAGLAATHTFRASLRIKTKNSQVRM